jgi:DNA-binding NtrC family response regulator
VLLIAEALLKGLAKQHGLPEPALRRETCDALLGHHWPGNVRELKNALERGLLINRTANTVLRLLPAYIVTDAHIDEAMSTLGDVL